MTTVGQVLSKVAKDLHEKDNTFALGTHAPYWTPDEMISYINYTEKDFLRRTAIVVSDLPIILPAGNAILFQKPSGAMDIERISFNGKRMRRQTTWDLSRENQNWRNNSPGAPRYWHEDHLNVNDLEVDRRPVAGGTFRFFCTVIPVEHVAYPAGYLEDIPFIDAWEPYIRWNVLSLALGKDGDMQDIARSAYCQQRYLLGVALANRLVFGTALQMNAAG
jgi:hypothetical protein